MNERNKQLLKSKIRQEAFMWYSILPGGVLIAVGLVWYAATHNMLGPAPSGGAAIWTTVQPFFWVGSVLAFLAGSWVRVKWTTPETLDRAPFGIPVKGHGFGGAAAAPPADIDEEGKRIWELYTKITGRGFLAATFLDAPSMVAIGILLATRIDFSLLWFAAGYAIVVGILHRPQNRTSLVESALRLQSEKPARRLVSE